MEKDANYFTVGIFVSLALLALVGFTIWLTGVQDFSDRTRYTVYFTDPLSGLEKEATVKYKGVDVGRIVNIRLVPERSDLIKVDIEVDTDAPIRASTDATISMQGITGIAYIDLSTPNTDKTPPRRVAGEPYPVLTGKGSQLTKFFDEMPAIGSQFKATLTAIDQLSQHGTKTVDSIRGLADEIKEDPSKIISPPSYEGVKDSKMRSSNMLQRGLLVLPALILVGCINVSVGNRGEPPAVYTLGGPAQASGNPSAPASARATGAAIVVPKPELPPGLESERIALSFEKDHRLDYYADSKWSAPLPDLLQDFVIGRIQEKLPGTTVGTPELTRSAKSRLAIKFTEFQPVYADTPDKAPRLDVAMTVTVVGLPGEKVKTQFSVQRSVPASANTMTAVTKELGTLLQGMIDEALEKAAPQLS